MTEVPISSLALVPVTEDTRQKLIDYGVEVPATEAEALGLEELRDDASVDAPTCFGEYARGLKQCVSCNFRGPCEARAPTPRLKVPPPPLPPLPSR